MRTRRRSEDFRAELEAHLELETERFRDQGLGEEAARRAAHRSLGNLTRIQERFYETRHWIGWEQFRRDVGLACRGLRRAPSFTVAAVATLALAIGANTIVFAAFNAVVLHPLPVPGAASLYELQPRLNDTTLHESYPDYLDFRDRNRSFDGLAAFSIAQAGFEAGGRAEPVWVDEVSGNYFDVLRLQPAAGRLLHASDEHGANSVPGLVISYDYWQARFHGDPAIIGRTVRFNRHPFALLGVAPRGFRGTILFFTPQFYVPLLDQAEFEDASTLGQRAADSIFVGAMGHLKPGVSVPSAVADMNAIGAELNRTYPKDEQPYSFSLKRPGLYGDFLGRPVRGFVLALMLLAGLTLAAACLNLGSLFAARASDRERELALRVALGAGRGRVMRLLLTEAVAVAVLGAGLGLAGSVALLQWLVAWQPFPQFPIHIPVSADANVYVFSAVMALASGLLFGAGAAGRVLRTEAYQVIKSDAREGDRPQRITARQVLLGAQLAACAMLITTSLVAVRGLARSLHSDFGFDPSHVLLVRCDLSMAGYSGPPLAQQQQHILDSVRAMPGIEAAGMADWVPLGMEGWQDEAVYRGDSRDLRSAHKAADATILKISPGYFKAAGTLLLAGRSVSAADGPETPRVAVVNAEFARRLFGSVSRAVGGSFQLQDRTRIKVVGIVEDGKYNSLTEDAEPAMFLPLRQAPSATWIVLRSERATGELTAAVRSQLRQLDPGLPFYAQTWATAMDGALFPARAAAVALGILGLMGVMLSLSGIFGLAAYAVSRRKRELGIRLALGASSGEILWAALGPALRVLAVGSTVGLVLGILGGRVLTFVVYQASPRDPVVLIAAVGAMTLIGLLATWIPAQRALASDPLSLLREE